MSTFHAHAGVQMTAAPERVYALLADYRTEHPAILPRPPFYGLEVLEGGTGAGTQIRVHMKTFGQERFLLGTVSEPEPGRVLAETFEDPTAGTTTFTVEPSEGGSYVTIATRGKTNYTGFLGAIEGFIVAWYLEYVYRQELAHIDSKTKMSE